MKYVKFSEENSCFQVHCDGPHQLDAVEVQQENLQNGVYWANFYAWLKLSKLIMIEFAQVYN